ncbi:hypothetical protein [Paenibacillus glufosinatiresistens]|uniref:hypothetical protein n=1 Tax=Paenibacillus glufosinatiresistens TaxID=3070657 RepID=UPI0038CD8E11
MNFIVGSMIVCEAAFWVFIILGLLLRYVLGKKGLGMALLSLTPVLDLYLLVVAGVDLYNGATATLAHALAAVYIGVSIAFGRSMIRWADERFRYYVLKQGEKPVKRYGMDYAIQDMKGVLRHAAAFVIGAGLLVFTDWAVGEASRTELLIQTVWKWMLILGIDFLIGVSHFIWPKKQKPV